jgi:TRIAD3 protein (E3 ubiquitin-protein ligase RNF216)
MEPARNVAPQPQVIDLVSDDEDLDFLGFDDNILDRYFDGPLRGADEYLDEPDAWPAFNSPHHGANNPIDLTGPEDRPGTNVTSASLSTDNPMTNNTDEDLSGAELVTEAACLQMVLNVLPDVSVEHALGLVHEGTKDDTRTLVECERIIAQLLDGGDYPKELEEQINRKRKRDEEESLDEFETDAHAASMPTYFKDA